MTEDQFQEAMNELRQLRIALVALQPLIVALTQTINHDRSGSGQCLAMSPRSGTIQNPCRCTGVCLRGNAQFGPPGSPAGMVGHGG